MFLTLLSKVVLLKYPTFAPDAQTLLVHFTKQPKRL